MGYNVWLFAAIWGSLFSTLHLFPQLELVRILAILGSFILTGVVADLLVKLIVNLLPRKMLPNLHNKAVIITGCSSGFGLSLAKKLDALGVTVYAGLRKPLCPGALELKETCSSNMHVIVLDVTKDQDVQDAVHYVNKTIGHKELYAVVNNAGVSDGCLLELTPPEVFNKVWDTNTLGSVRVSQAFMPLLRKSSGLFVFTSELYAVVNNAGVSDGCLLELTPPEVFNKVWDTNTLGSVRVSQAFMPLLRKSSGRVVLVNSAFGFTAVPGALAYSMSKYALRGFGDALRRELRRWRVSVHSVHPYFYKTSIVDFDKNMEMLNNMWKQSPQEVRDAYGEKFLTLLKESAKKWLMDVPSTNIDEPIDDIIDAAFGATPKMIYLSGWGAKIYYFVEQFFPRSTVDYIVSTVTGVF